jgi:malate dehydrogenase
MVKIGFVGTGQVGATSAYAATYLVDCDEIALVDVRENIAVGEAMDLETAAIVVGKNITVHGGSDYSLLNHSDVVVISAGIARRPGMTRLDLDKTNAGIVSDIIKRMMPFCSKTIIVMVTNPVDIMTYVAYKISKKPRNEILGIGSLHDTARLTGELRKMGATNIEAMMVGEHGDSMLPLKSQTKFAGASTFNWDKIVASVKERGMEIIKRKGATTYAPASCVASVIKAIVNNERKEMPISAVLNGEYGLKDVAIGVPTIVGKNGIQKIIEYDLNDDELGALKKSASIIKEFINDTLR